jgi:hypothetical protein
MNTPLYSGKFSFLVCYRLRIISLYFYVDLNSLNMIKTITRTAVVIVDVLFSF